MLNSGSTLSADQVAQSLAQTHPGSPERWTSTGHCQCTVLVRAISQFPENLLSQPVPVLFPSQVPLSRACVYLLSSQSSGTGELSLILLFSRRTPIPCASPNTLCFSSTLVTSIRLSHPGGPQTGCTIPEPV